ncbi:anticodon-binding domain protein [Medicago truncatula]|uniref:Anticodon-binding domain protein n=1 Tax=Medicago truncatula TaxID=3880 RepID=G7K3E3_MEDTR|nr:anticodon-binding domain protein [Medicago truncatula]
MARPTKTEVLVSRVGNRPGQPTGAYGLARLRLVIYFVGQAQAYQSLAWPGLFPTLLVSILGNDVPLALFDYAKVSRIPWMILVGEREIKEGTVQLISLKSGNDVNINILRKNLVKELRKWLNPSPRPI